MRKLIAKPFLCLLALVLAVSIAATGCSWAFPGATEENTKPITQTKPAPSALAALRGDQA